MNAPRLKRINVHSEQELDVWLSKNTSHEDSVLVVTHTDTSHGKFVSREQVGQVLAKHGWEPGMRYTMGSDLLGHVITRCGK